MCRNLFYDFFFYFLPSKNQKSVGNPCGDEGFLDFIADSFVASGLVLDPSWNPGAKGSHICYVRAQITHVRLLHAQKQRKCIATPSSAAKFIGMEK